MRLIFKGCYVVIVMFDVVFNFEMGLVLLVDILECQGILFFYLEQLFFCLCKNGLVFSVCGLGGGYLLGKDVGSIVVGEVISVVDEFVDVICCQGKGGCQGGDKCLIYVLWCDLSECLIGFLNNIIFGELVNNQEIFDVFGCQYQYEIQCNVCIQDVIDVKLCV